MSGTLTKSQLDGMIEEAIKAHNAKAGIASKAEWDALQAEHKKALDRITALERQIAEEHHKSASPDSYQRAFRGFIERDRHKGAGLFPARVLRAFLAQELGLHRSATDLALKEWKDKATADAVDAMIQINGEKRNEQKALASQVMTDGGAILTTEESSELIPLLRADAVMLRMGPTIYSMNSMSMKIPRQTGSITAAFAAENEESNASQLSTDAILLTLKKLVGVTATSNEFLLFGGAQADAMIRNDLVETISRRLDLAMIRDVGSEGSIVGVRNALASGQISAALSYTLANVTSTLFSMLEDVASENVPMQGGGWVFCSRIMHALMALRDGNGNYAFKDEMSRGTLLGYPFAISNQIPQNLGGGTETEIYFVVFPEWAFGEGVSVGIKKADGAAYRNSAGTMVAGFSADQTAYRISTWFDWKPKHNVSGAIRTGATWAA